MWVQCFTGGSSKPAVRLEVNPNALTSDGVGLEALRASITGNNVERPTGYINGVGPDSKRIAIYTTDQLHGASAYAPLIVATNQGPVSSATASNALPKSEASSVSSPHGQHYRRVFVEQPKYSIKPKYNHHDHNNDEHNRNRELGRQGFDGKHIVLGEELCNVTNNNDRRSQ